MCAGGPDYTDANEDGVHFIFSGVPIPFFNVAVVTARDISEDQLRAAGERASTRASAKGVPWLFVLTHDTLKQDVDAASVLDGCGLGPMMPMTGMLAKRITASAQTTEDLELVVPDDDDGCSAILDVNGLAYGMDLTAGNALLGTRTFWRDHFPVVGLTGGKPASSAAVLMVDGCRYVALVATDPQQQRRGYADAAMRRALELSGAVHVDSRTVLHATDAGRPIYERMGYTPISTHTIFMDKAALAGH